MCGYEQHSILFSLSLWIFPMTYFVKTLSSHFAQHNGRVRRSFGLCDIIPSPYCFHVLGSFIIKSISGTWRKVTSLVWHEISSSPSRWDLTRRMIWSWKVQGTCIAGIPCFQGKRLRKKKKKISQGICGMQCPFLEWLVILYPWVFFIISKLSYSLRDCQS